MSDSENEGGRSYSFDIERAIATWRQFLISERSVSEEDLKELEAHLRDEIDYVRRPGMSDEEVYRRALQSVGDYATIGRAYREVFWEKLVTHGMLGQEARWRLSLIANYIRAAWRDLIHRKVYSSLNVFGLAVGISICFVIMLFVRHEMRYDRFHENADRTYRVLFQQERPSRSEVRSVIPESVGAGLFDTIPEVEYMVRIMRPFREVLVGRDEPDLYESGFLWADSQFFDVFSFEALSGDLSSALIQPGDLVLTASATQRHFGNQNPVGQTLAVVLGSGTTEDFTVRAVIRDVPTYSHLEFEMIAYREGSELLQWNMFSVTTYVTLVEGHSADDLSEKLSRFVTEKAVWPSFAGFIAPSVTLLLQPLQDIHLYPNWSESSTLTGPVQYLYLFSTVAVLILLLACVNFMNLSTARSSGRAREVGVRKSIGAHRRQLVAQFMTESAVLTVMALFVSIPLIRLFLKLFNELIGTSLSITSADAPALLLVLSSIALVAGLVSGSYPAFYLSAFQPTLVLKGMYLGTRSASAFRSVLVVFQFGISIGLITTTLVILQQMEYIRTSRLSAYESQVVVIKQAHYLGAGYENFKSELLAYPTIDAVTTADANPGGSAGMWAIYEDSTNHDNITLGTLRVGTDYLKTLGLDLIDGQSFSADMPATEGKPVILNETAISVFQIENPVGLPASSKLGTVIGVVRDFHFQPMQEKILPLKLQFRPEESLAVVMVRLDPVRISEGLDHLAQMWDKHVPGRPLQFVFLDEEMDTAYRAEIRLSKMFTAMAIIAIIIAVLGLLGLSAYVTERRTKEIGIRKVLGARIVDVLVLLSGDFVRLVIIAAVLTLPVTYIVLNRWLSDFAYHVDVSLWLAPVTIVLALIAALLAVSYHALKAAVANPSDALRHE